MKIYFKKIYLILLCFITISVFSGNHFTKAYAKNSNVYLGGFTLGFDLIDEGVLVVGLTEVICENGICLPAREAGIECGDYILSLNGIKVNSSEDIDEFLRNYDGKFIVLELISKGEKCIKNIYPIKDISGVFKLGLLVRDYISGLGTVTFVDQEGVFYSLGHPIVDESGNMLKINGGIAYECCINGIIKGNRGKAGQLQGSILKNKVLGTVVKNCNSGLSGILKNKALYEKRDKISLGTAKPGYAQIYSTIDGVQPKKYDICIIKVDENDKYNKNLVLRIDDQALIEQAGGIVQGMSGSPIIQNGKLVGAVTHVFLNDSTRGYGICISRMLNN